MLAIRLQRVGRSGHAQFRVIVQDSRLSPKSGKVVARLGSYDPHTKKVQVDTEKAKFYLDNGAQPSERVAKILKSEGVKLPEWVKLSDPIERKIKNPEKLRKNQPEQPAEEAPAEEAPVEAEDKPAEEKSEDKPAEEKSEESTESKEEAKEETKEDSPEEQPQDAA